MIETVMIFGLGFLLASLCALTILPTVSARASRLARRRIEATLPVSVSEVVAERDHLRAEFAVVQRRLERKAEAIAARRHADMAAIGTRTMETEAAVAARIRSEAEVARALERIAGLDRDLASARAEGETGLATLHALEEAHRAILDDLKATRRLQAATAPSGAAEIEVLRAELTAAQAALAARGSDDTAELRRRISEVADALARHDRLPQDRLPQAGAFPATSPALAES
ncbi:chromosome segregation ATPase [Methylorubrum extorquens]